MDLRKPFIDGKDDQEKIAQICDYLFKLVEELNFTLSTIEAKTNINIDKK